MKNMYLTTRIFAFLFLASATVFGQSWMKTQSLVSTQAQPVPKMNFYELQTQFNEHFKDMNMEQDEMEGPEDEGWHQFKRWEWFTEQRVYPTGEYPSPDILWNEYQNYKQMHSGNSNKTNMAPSWASVGPNVVPSNGGGAGRINCLTFLPGNTNTMFIGAACGGVWKTTNGGTNWATLNTDLLPSMSISDIAIDPLNTNNMYIATGDNYGIYYQYSTTGHYSAGVMKSTNGGTTWASTGMIYTQNQLNILQRLIIHPTNPQILLVTSNTGIYRTTNGGTSWTNVQAGSFYSIEFNPLNPNVVYATSGLEFYRSNNAGLTWVKKTTGLQTTDDRQTLKTTPADTNVIYVWGTTGMRRSANGGTSFVNITSTNCGGYGYYDRVIAVSPTNANDLYTGGLNVSRSTNGGTSWTVVSAWSPYTAANYCHADQKRMEFLPGSGTTVFAVNDGGIFKSITGGTSWTDLSNTLQIGEFYRISSAATNANIIYFGAQDNGSSRWNGSTWVQVYGADGMQPLVDYTNSNNVFVSSQSGGMRKSTDGGTTFAACSPAGGPWVAPYVMDPVNPQIMYYGSSSGVYKSTTGGGAGTWSKVSGTTIGSVIYLAVAKSNTSYVYAAEYGKIYQSTNAGTSWTNVTGTLPVSSASITGIAVCATNPSKVWVTFSGYSAGNKVYATINGGTTWTNYSGTLPNIPTNTIVYDNGGGILDVLYIGTDFGVYYRNASSTDWTAYNTGLPNVIIDHLEIHYGILKLRAGTYGRGIWQVDLSPTTGIATSNFDKESSFSVFPNPSNGLVTVTLNQTNGGSLRLSVYNLVGEKVKENAENSFAGMNQYQLDLSDLSKGVYFVKVETPENTFTQKVTLSGM